jgi:hypothetical protein
MSYDHATPGQKALMGWQAQYAEESALRMAINTEEAEHPAKPRRVCLTCVAGAGVALVAAVLGVGFLA